MDTQHLNRQAQKMHNNMENKNGIRFRYSNKEHLHKTKRVKYQKLIQNYKNKNTISITLQHIKDRTRPEHL